MKRRGLVVALTAFLMKSVGVAKANEIATYVEPQTGAPVEVLGCNAGLQYVNSGYGTSFYRLNMYAQFENTSSKIAVAVLIRFQLENAFGDVLDNRFGQTSGKFSPETEIDGNKWSDTDIWAGLGAVRCSVSRVLFDDGSTWHDANTPLPTASK
jgi:hypothetical protein